MASDTQPKLPLTSDDEYAAMLQVLFAPSNLPSQARHAAWLYASLPKKAFLSNSKTGKWCIFRKTGQVDKAWKRVSEAVTDGRLALAKVSTVLHASSHQGRHVICVYTTDYADQAAVMACRDTLRDLGFTEELGYKRDIDTRNGVYGEKEWFYRA